jgi:PIN domain nuclease of toxin-antitoxin system
MSLLVDTHVILWWLADDPTLSDELKDALDTEPDVRFSPASVWEVTIKQGLGKLKGPDDLPERIRDCGLRELPVTSLHAMTAGRLPAVHRDPFDRLLIAQARSEGLTLVTRDRDIHRYDVAIRTA